MSDRERVGNITHEVIDSKAFENNESQSTLKKLALLYSKCFSDQGATPNSPHNIMSFVTLDGAGLILLYQQDVPVGFLIWRSIIDEAELLLMGVDKKHRKKGFGRKLLRLLGQVLFEKNVLKVHLEVRSSNEGAINLYKSNGFALMGQRENYYPLKNGNRENAVIMCKVL